MAGICPHCDRPLQLLPRSYMNADTYGKSNISVTECCGKPVRVTPVRRYRIEPYVGDRTEDDWGVTIKRKKTR